MWLALLFACQEPFDTDRHDLVGDRVAAIELRVDADGWRPRVAATTGGRPWADAVPELSWHWLTDPDALADLPPAARPDATGPSPTLAEPPPGHSVLGLRADWGDHQALAFVDVGALGREPAARGFSALAHDHTPARPSPGDDLGLAARRGLPTREGPGPVDALQRIAVAPVGETPVQLRWMATAGTFLELDDHATDWFAGDLVLDEGQVEEVSPGAAGPVTVVVLAVGDGLPSFTAADLVVGPMEPGTWIGGRWLPGVELTANAVVRLQADDTAPSGLRARPHAGPAEVVPCLQSNRLDLDALLELRCTRDELVGTALWAVPSGRPIP